MGAKGSYQSLANCGMLEVLDLGNNRMVDSFPSWLGNLSMLQVLILHSNQFYGSVELPLQGERSDYHFPSLRILDLSSNIFTGNLPWSLFENLTAMMVSSSAGMNVLEFNALVLPAYSYLDTVAVINKRLDISLVKILTTFTMIDVSNNQFHGAIPEVIGNLRSLRALNMSTTPSPKEFLMDLGAWRSLSLWTFLRTNSRRRFRRARAP